jgi:hypothetical protein
MYRSANDWRFTSELEASVPPEGVGAQARLFYFQSDDQEVGAWVFFVGLGMGFGVRARPTRQSLDALSQILDYYSKPRVGSREFRLAATRTRLPNTALDLVNSDEWYSMAELNNAQGSVTSVGGGFILGGSALSAQAMKGDKLLFACERIGADLGSFGINFGDAQHGVWQVMGAWDLE